LESLPWHSWFFRRTSKNQSHCNVQWPTRIRAPWGCRQKKSDSRRLQAPPHRSSRWALQGV
jgi:hypothetical protein